MSSRLKIVIGVVALTLLAMKIGYWLYTDYVNRKVGEPIDELNGVAIYFNGSVDRVAGRNQTADGYNIGLRYQCVEFVKRYYLERFGHRMPDSYGHARDFYDQNVKDGEWNARRGLLQFANGSISKPVAEDLIVFAPTSFNAYGHVAIISRSEEDRIEIAQQNPGPFRPSREQFTLTQKEGRWWIAGSQVLGWLRRKDLR